MTEEPDDDIEYMHGWKLLAVWIGLAVFSGLTFWGLYKLAMVVL